MQVDDAEVGGQYPENFPYSSPEAPNAHVARRLIRFKTDLLQLSALDVVRKHVLMGPVYILNHDDLFQMSKRIAEKYEINPQQIQVVGSGKLGFSIAADKRYRPFANTSDIDVAIVSESLFDRIWLEVVRYHNSVPAWDDVGKFRKYLMNGWIRPDALPRGSDFPRTQAWWRFFSDLSRTVRNGQFKVSAGLYRSSEFLELYQERSVSQCISASTEGTV